MFSSKWSNLSRMFMLFLISSQFVESSMLSEKYTEKLEIFQLRSSSASPKSLWHFTFDFENDFNVENHITYEAVPSRSVLENIFLYSNTTDLRIEVANGKPNEFLLDQGSFYFSLPKEGKTVYASESARWGDLMYQIQEIFSLSVQHLAKRNYYKYESDVNNVKAANKKEQRDNFPNYESSFLYGSDPTDYICNDFIEKMKAFFPCKGSKGLFTKLSIPKIFSSDYISSSIGFHYDREVNKAYFRVEVNIIGENDLLNSSEKYSQCHRYETSQLVDHRSLINPSKDYERIDIGEDSFLLYKIDNLPQDLYSKNILSSRRYITNSRFNFESKLIHELTNKNGADKTVKAVFYEYFLNQQIHPIFHKITMVLDNKEKVDIKDKVEIEYLKGKYSLVKFKVEIPRNSTLKIEIPFEKLLKPFENYPHDPARGEDLIPSLVLLSDQNRISKVVSDNILVELPHSDFSMPFTIIAIVMSIVGFLSMNIYRAIFENPKKIEKSRLEKLKEKIKEKCLKRNKDKKD